MIIDIATLRANKARDERNKRLLEKYMRLLELHEIVRAALAVEPVQVDSIEEAAVWISVNELYVALECLFPGEE